MLFCFQTGNREGPDLVCMGGLLVSRRKTTGGKTVKIKNMEDIWTLVGSIRYLIYWI